MKRRTVKDGNERMSNFSKNNAMKRKIGLVAVILSVVCSSVLVLRLFYLQIIQGDQFKQMALNQQLRDTVIAPHRGSIYDTNMKTLATSKTVWDVVLEPANLSKKDETREKELQVLCDPQKGLPALLGVSEELIREKAKNLDSYWQVLAYKVEKETADKYLRKDIPDTAKMYYIKPGKQEGVPFRRFGSFGFGFCKRLR